MKEATGKPNLLLFPLLRLRVVPGLEDLLLSRPVLGQGDDKPLGTVVSPASNGGALSFCTGIAE